MPKSGAPRPSKLRPARLIWQPLTIALALAALAAPSVAENTSERRWSLVVSGVWLSPTGNEVQATSPEGNARFDVSDGGGFGLGIDYRVSRHWGVELTFRSVDLDTDLDLSTPDGSLKATDSMRFELFGLGANYHLLVRERFDLYLGGTVVMSKGSDQIFATGSGEQVKLTFDDDVGYELTLGADFGLGSSGRWLLRGEIGYLTTILETDSNFQDLDLDPVTLLVGLGYRF